MKRKKLRGIPTFSQWKALSESERKEFMEGFMTPEPSQKKKSRDSKGGELDSYEPPTELVIPSKDDKVVGYMRKESQWRRTS